MLPRYLFPSDYMADPSANVFGGRLYIYPSHDWDSGATEDDNGDHFQMRDYHVLSLDDVENGQVTDHGQILCIDDVPWVDRQMWDNDVAEVEGRYYLVYSAKDHCGVFHLGVASADTPAGPFKAEADPIRGSYSIDPCLFKDDDGKVYVYFGGLWGGQLQRYRDNEALESAHLPEGDEDALPSRVALMATDMKQFAEAPRGIIITDADGKPLKASDPHRFFEASWMHKYKGKYYFSYSTGDTHTLCYATGDSPYGPFRYQGVLLDPVVGWTTHHSIVEFKGHWYLFYHDCVPSNDTTWLRSLKVQELFYRQDGTIEKVKN